MEKDIYSKFNKIRRNTELSTAEKDFHRNEIIKFMEKLPSPYTPEKMSTAYFRLFMGRHLILASLAMVFILGGGLTVVNTNGSLPNEYLYKIKTNITEPLALFFIPTSQGKTFMKVALVNKRLQEFSKITLNKNLSPKDKVNFVGRLSLQIKDTQKEILHLAEEKNNTSGAFHANNNLQSMLVIQDEILEKIYTTNPDAGDTSEFTSMINTSIEEAAQIEDKIINSVSASGDEDEIDQTINKLKKEIDASLEEIEETKQDISKSTDNLDVINQESFDTAISDIQEDLEIADQKDNEEDNKEEVLKLYNKIDKNLGKLKSLIATKKHLKFEKKD